MCSQFTEVNRTTDSLYTIGNTQTILLVVYWYYIDYYYYWYSIQSISRFYTIGTVLAILLDIGNTVEWESSECALDSSPLILCRCL